MRSDSEICMSYSLLWLQRQISIASIIICNDTNAHVTCDPPRNLFIDACLQLWCLVRGKVFRVSVAYWLQPSSGWCTANDNLWQFSLFIWQMALTELDHLLLVDFNHIHIRFKSDDRVFFWVYRRHAILNVI